MPLRCYITSLSKKANVFRRSSLWLPLPRDIISEIHTIIYTIIYTIHKLFVYTSAYHIRNVDSAERILTQDHSVLSSFSKWNSLARLEHVEVNKRIRALKAFAQIGSKVHFNACTLVWILMRVARELAVDDLCHHGCVNCSAKCVN